MKIFRETILFGKLNQAKPIPFDDILYCIADGNYTHIYTNHGTKPYLISETLKDVEDQIQNGLFYRINRATLINLDYLSKFKLNDDRQIKLQNGQIFDVSLRRKNNFKRYLKTLK